MSREEQQFTLACRYHDSGQAQPAIGLLTELLAVSPNEAIYHGLLASCLLMQRRIVAAEHEVSIALGLDPTVTFLHQVRARILLLQRKPKEALAACDEALRIDPDSVECHLLKASINQFQNDMSAVKANLDNAAALDPQNVGVAVAYGDYYNRTGKHDKALEFATQALQLNPASDIANILMGETQLALGNVDEADYHAKFAITRDPTSTEALRLFANIRMRRNWFIGAWWRFNTWLATLGNLRSALILIGGFLTFTILAEVAEDLGYTSTSTFLSSAWLLLVVYSWVGIPMYRKALSRELENFTFNPKF